MNGCILRIACLFVLTAWSANVAATSTIVVPIDLEQQALEMNTLCSTAAPDLNPGYLERFEAWKKRLGPYYQRYQQLLYDAPVMHLPVEERASKLKELIALVEKETAKRMLELQTNRRKARELCLAMSKWISDPKTDEELKSFVHEMAEK